MKKAIRSFFGLKSKPKQDKNDSRDRDKYKDRPLEKTRTTTVSNSTLNSAVDPHRRSSNSNRPCVIVNEEPHDPQQHLQAASYRENSSCKLFTPLQPRPRPYSEFILNTRPRSATFTTTPNLCPPDVQAARRLYLYQPQKIDLGVGVGGPAPVAYAPQDNTGSSSYNISRLDQVKRSQSTRTPASASQAVYDNGDPHQIYHCVARSSPSTPPSLFTAQDRGCGISPHQKAEPDDGSSKLLLSSVFAEDSLDQLSSGGGDNDSQDLRHMNLAHNLVNLGSHSTDICVNPGERIEQEVASSRKVAMTCIGEDSGSICTNTTSHDIHHHDQQGQGYRHKERLYKVPQRLLPDLERALPPLPDPDPAPAAEPVSNTTTSDDSKKRSSLTSPTSAFILNKRPDSGVESSTAKKRTPSVKGKDVNRGGCGIQPNTPSAVSPYVRQFDLDVDKYMTNNSIPGLETHPYRVSLEHDLRVQARAYARGLAEERGSTQEEAVEKAKEDIADVEVNIAPFVSFEPLSAESSAQPQSIQPKAPQSRSTFSIKSSPHSQVATTPEVKRLSNNSRGSARRIIYSADLEQGLPKGHIARESNYEIVPTKRHSASSTRTHNTSSKSRGYTTHVATTADNLDGVPGGPALAAATLIIHPDNCGKAARVIMTVNSQESNNAVLQSLGSVSTKGSGVTDSEMGVPQQFMSTHLNHVRAVDSNALSFIAKKEREGVVYFGAERTASEPSGDQTNLASSASKAEVTLLRPIDATIEHRLRMAKRPTTIMPGRVTSQDMHSDPLNNTSFLSPSLSSSLSSSTWIQPARMRSLDMVLERIDWSLPPPRPSLVENTTDTSTASNSCRTSYVSALADIADLTTLSFGMSLAAPPQGEEEGDKDKGRSSDGGKEKEVITYSVDNPSLIVNATAHLDSAHINKEVRPTGDDSNSSRRPPVLINGLTPEELINSVRFEYDREGTLGFYGPREFERDQEKRRREERAKKEVAKATARPITNGSRQREMSGIGAVVRGMVSTPWLQMRLPLLGRPEGVENISGASISPLTTTTK